MTLKYLLDENVHPLYGVQLRRRCPDLVVRAVGEPATPPKSTLIIYQLSIINYQLSVKGC